MRTTTTTTTIVVVMFLVLSSAPPWAAAQLGLGAPPPPDYGPGPPRVDLKMAIVMVLLVTVFFVLGFLSVYTRQCAQDRFRARLDLGFAGPGGAAGWAHSHGLDPEVIDTFPTFVYSTVKGLKIGKDSLECAVCLNEFEDSETLRLIPKCDHVFHPDCIDAWLTSHSTCPVCRANLVPKPGETAVSGSTLAEFLNPVYVRDTARPEVVEEPGLNRDASKSVREEELPAVNLVVRGDQESGAARPPRSRSTGFGPARTRSTGWRLGGIFPRSHSTGHSLVRPGESHERFTLRLPEEVRSQLVANSVALNRARSSGAALPRVGSARRGYRSGSARRKDGSVHERFEPEGKQDGRWVFSRVPPFVLRSGSVRSSKGAGGDDHSAGRHKASTSSDVVGERSTDPLRPEDQV